MTRIYRVRPRWRMDAMSISSPGDFRYSHRRDCEAAVVARDPTWSPYCLDGGRQEAVFVETPPGTRLGDAPFYYQGQRRHATAAIKMPLEEMHTAADAVGDRFEQAVMIHSTGRCGSTLLSKMFTAAGCQSYSEPDIATQLIARDWPADQTVDILRSAHRLYWQENPARRQTHLVLKFRSFCIELAEVMHQATPNTVSLFLYRDAREVVASAMRAFRYPGAAIWWVDLFWRAWITRPLLWPALALNMKMGQRMFPLMRRFTARELARFGMIGMLTMAWLSAVNRYLQLRAAGQPIVAVRYVDLVGQPEATLAAIFDHCCLDRSLAPAAAEAASSDSQAGSVVSRKRQRPYELSRRDLQIMDEVFARQYEVTSIDELLPGTISARST